MKTAYGLWVNEQGRRRITEAEERKLGAGVGEMGTSACLNVATVPQEWAHGSPHPRVPTVRDVRRQDT